MLDAPASFAKLALLAMNDIPTGSFIGRSLARREDRRLLNDYVAEALQPTTTSREDYFPNRWYRFAAVPSVRSWHKADVGVVLNHVCYWE